MALMSQKTDLCKAETFCVKPCILGKNMIMVGDTEFDVLGAAKHNIPCIGVSWGYGSIEQMVSAGATAIANSMQELLQYLCK